MGTLVKQLMNFNVDILGVPITPAPAAPSPPSGRLMSAGTAGGIASLGAGIKVHKKEDSLFWKFGEPIFDTVRDVFTKSADMAREDLERRQWE